MTEPTIDFRQKYIRIGREQGSAQAAEDVLFELESLAAADDVELALEQRIIALKKGKTEASASALQADTQPQPDLKGGQSTTTSANRDFGDQVVEAYERNFPSMRAASKRT